MKRWTPRDGPAPAVGGLCKAPESQLNGSKFVAVADDAENETQITNSFQHFGEGIRDYDEVMGQVQISNYMKGRSRTRVSASVLSVTKKKHH